jgi:transposase
MLTASRRTCHLSTMTGNRRYISPDQKALITVMSAHLSSTDISEVTGISRRTVQRVIRLWKTTSKMVRKPLLGGRPLALNTVEIMVQYSASFARWWTLVQLDMAGLA